VANVAVVVAFVGIVAIVDTPVAVSFVAINAFVVVAFDSIVVLMVIFVVIDTDDVVLVVVALVVTSDKIVGGVVMLVWRVTVEDVLVMGLDVVVSDVKVVFSMGTLVLGSIVTAVVVAVCTVAVVVAMVETGISFVVDFTDVISGKSTDVRDVVILVVVEPSEVVLFSAKVQCNSVHYKVTWPV